MNENTPIVVFTDSLAVVRSVEAGHSASRPNLLRHLYELIHQTNQDVTLVWIPAHIGIPGNEMADRLANEGVTKPYTEIEVNLEITEIYNVIDEFCKDRWQNEWSKHAHEQFLMIEPNVLSQWLVAKP